MHAKTLLAVPVAAIALGGCIKGGGLPNLPGIEQFLPKVRFKRLAVDDVDFKRIDTQFVFEVDNPNPIKVGLATFDYTLDLKDQRLLGGDAPDGLSLPSRGTAPLKLPVSVAWADVLQLATAPGGKGQDHVPFTFAGSIGFNTPLGVVKVPFSENGKFPVLRVPKINFQKVKVGKVDILRQTATLDVVLGVQHQQASALDFLQFDYGLDLGGKRIASGLVSKLATVQPGETASVALPITVNLLEVGKVVVDAITGKGGKVQVGLDAALDVKTPFGVVPLKIDETGKVTVE